MSEQSNEQKDGHQDEEDEGKASEEQRISTRLCGKESNQVRSARVYEKWQKLEWFY